MDGSVELVSVPMARYAEPEDTTAGFTIGAHQAPLQRTLKAPIDCTGIGLHSGLRARITLHPAAPDTGIVFTRVDLPGTGLGRRDGAPLPARHEYVVDTQLCTVIGAGDVRIGTVEHLVAALAGMGIDNALIELDGPELPILDGSAAGFLFLIDCAGIEVQQRPRRVIEVLRTVRVEIGEAWAELRPSWHGRSRRATPGFDLRMTIDFAASAIGRQSHSLRLTPESFRHELAAARTFTQEAEIMRLRAQGLALGGTLYNAVVVNGDRVLNPGGLRMRDEFVRHKLLDAVGDLALAGWRLRGSMVAHRGGHAINNRLLQALFANPTAWRLTAAAVEGWREAA
jgi:UDP-3-O-[3-hydroxymyristoyl] N-acetylglucosamine deacetylase